MSVEQRACLRAASSSARSAGDSQHPQIVVALRNKTTVLDPVTAGRPQASLPEPSPFRKLRLPWCLAIAGFPAACKS